MTSTMFVLVVSSATSDQQTLNPGINYYSRRAVLGEKFQGTDGKNYYTINYITDSYGNDLVDEKPVQGVVAEKAILFPEQDQEKVDRLQSVDKIFYRRDQEGQLVAEGFVDAKPANGLITASRIPLGTGIYGKYFVSETAAKEDLLIGESIYSIDATDCYHLLDGPHGDLFVLASIYTNRYVSKILNGDLQSTKDADVKTLVRLWKMVFFRTLDEEKVTAEKVMESLSQYIDGYYLAQYEVDDGTYGQLMPVNIIMANLGYQGIFAIDSYNNSRDRGCVAYRIDQATKFRIGNAQY